MAGIAIVAPKGVVPRTLSRLQNPNQGSAAFNCVIRSGALRPLRGLEQTHLSNLPNIRTLYRYRFGSTYNWLVWDAVIDVTRSPVAQDSIGRFFYTGDGEPRMSTYADAISGAGPYPAAFYTLGVTPPIAPMAITVVGGALADETRAYVYTFVNRLGEESGPSPAIVKVGKPDGSWNITNMNAAPPNAGTISNAVANTPLAGQVTVTLDSAFGLTANEQITFAGVSGMTALNGTFSLVSGNPLTGVVVVALATAQVFSASANSWARRAPHNTTGMVKRIYRTLGTNTDFKLVAEIAASATTYNDTIPSATVSLNNGIPTLNTLPPIKTMTSLVILANGVLAGIAENQVCFTEIGKPYSWPLANRYTIPGTAIALFAADNAVICLTDNYPHVVTASVPEAASVAKIQGEMFAPCLSKLGAVDIGGGVIYPSHDGLYLATPNGLRNITEALFTFDDWQAYMPTSFKSAFHNGVYYAAHNTSTTPRIMSLDTKAPGDGILAVNDTATALYSNPWDGILYAAQGNKVSQWDASATVRYQSSWTSPDFQSGRPISYAVGQVKAKFEEFAPADTSIRDFNLALLATINDVCGEIATFEVGTTEIAGSRLLPVPPITAPGVQFTLLRHGVAVFSRQITSDRTFKLPALAKAEIHALQISATIPWYSVNVAESAAELTQAAV